MTNLILPYSSLRLNYLYNIGTHVLNYTNEYCCYQSLQSIKGNTVYKLGYNNLANGTRIRIALAVFDSSRKVIDEIYLNATDEYTDIYFKTSSVATYYVINFTNMAQNVFTGLNPYLYDMSSLPQNNFNNFTLMRSGKCNIGLATYQYFLGKNSGKNFYIQGLLLAIKSIDYNGTPDIIYKHPDVKINSWSKVTTGEYIYNFNFRPFFMNGCILYEASGWNKRNLILEYSGTSIKVIIGDSGATNKRADGAFCLCLMGENVRKKEL